MQLKHIAASHLSTQCTLVRQRALGFALLAMISSMSAQAVMDEPVQQAVRMVEAKQPQEAFKLLAPLEVERSGDVDFDLVFGIAASRSGQYTQALFALERVLAVNPGHTRARAELALVYAAVKDQESAKTLIGQAKDEVSTVEAAQAIAAFSQLIDQNSSVAQIEQAKQAGKNWSAYISAGAGYDSNVTSGTSANTIRVFNLDLPTPDNWRKTHSSFASVSAGASAYMDLQPNWTLWGSVNGSTRANGGSNQRFNSSSLNMSAGPSYRNNRNELHLRLQYSLGYLESSRVSTQNGASLEWNYHIDGFRQISTFADYARTTLAQQSANNTQRYVLGGTYSAQVRQAPWFYYMGWYAGKERPQDSNAADIGNRYWGLRGGFNYTLRPDLSAYTSLAYEKRRFAAIDPLTQLLREDATWTAGLGLNWTVARDWRVNPNISLTDNRSTISDLNSYQRAAASINVRRDF